jgi:hypothetical protein
MAILIDETSGSQTSTDLEENGVPYRNNTSYRSSNTYRGNYVLFIVDETSSNTNLTDETYGS